MVLFYILIDQRDNLINNLNWKTCVEACSQHWENTYAFSRQHSLLTNIYIEFMHVCIYNDIICVILWSVLSVQIKNKLYKASQAGESFTVVAKGSRKDMICIVKILCDLINVYIWVTITKINIQNISITPTWVPGS